MFYIDFLSDSALSIESSLWSGGANFALHQLGYLIDLCQPVSEARGTRFHRSAERGSGGPFCLVHSHLLPFLYILQF